MYCDAVKELYMNEKPMEELADARKEMERAMGFTVWLGILYIVLIGLTIFSFVQKKKGIGIGLLAAVVISILILGYMWVTSPM